MEPATILGGREFLGGKGWIWGSCLRPLLCIS